MVLRKAALVAALAETRAPKLVRKALVLLTDLLDEQLGESDLLAAAASTAAATIAAASTSPQPPLARCLCPHPLVLIISSQIQMKQCDCSNDVGQIMEGISPNL